jgi:transcriptional regulator with XRE-family HTH domain
MTKSSNPGSRSEEGSPTLGARLRAVREAHGVSLAKAAEDTGVSRSFLSLVERGESDISFGRLHRLINYYGIHIGDLVPTGRAEVEGYVAAGTETLLHSPSEGIELHLLAPDTEHSIAPFICIFAAGAHTTDWEGHDGEEFVHVAEGSIEVSFYEREPLTMRRGDSLMYGGREVCGMRNPTKRETRIYVTVCPPIF